MPTIPQNPYLSDFGFTAGPPGSSGGLRRNMAVQNPMQPMWAPNQAQMPNGYGTAPGMQGSPGYYEQQTPGGSFAAAEAARAPNQQQAFNPYIGAQSQGINGMGSVLPYAQQIAQSATQANPYLGMQSQQAQGVGQNQFMGQNPYLQQSVNAGLQQAGQNFSETVMPTFDRAARQSGSFGNTGVEAARGRAIDAFGRSQADTANRAYMQDYTNSQQLAENALNRQQGMNQFNATLGANDLTRNLAGAFTGQNIGMQGLSSLLGAAQFDVNSGLNTQQFNAGLGSSDLSRNSQLAQSLGQFNAGQGNQLGLAGSQMQQQANLYNAGAGNNMLENFRNRGQQQGQFDANLDRQIWNDNMGWMRQGQQDQLGLMGQLMGWNQGGIGNANYLQNLPLQYLQQFGQLGMGLGGMGTSQTQNLNGNPLLGALGGWQLMSQLFNNGGG